MEEKLIYKDSDANESRLDLYLLELFPDRTRSALQKLIKSGEILVNSHTVKCGYELKESDEILLHFSEVSQPEIKAQDMDLDIVYEDEDVIIINKPKDMVVHPAPGHYEDTLVNGLMAHCKDSLSGINGVARPGIVHRIDKDTTGLIIACKNDKSHQSIANQLKEHTITRAYRAIVHGNIKCDSGTIEGAIGRHPVNRKKMALNEKNGKPAITHYRVIERFGNYTYVECILETGRTHQIRVHMASIGHPLLGDALYGPSKCPIPGLHGQCLHAMTLGFVHPDTEKYMEFSAPIPEEMKQVLMHLNATMGRA